MSAEKQFDVFITTLSADSLVRWRTFRSSLAVNRTKLLFDFALGTACLGAGLFFADPLLRSAPFGFKLLSVPLLSVWVGFWVHYLSCYLHESAHFNLLASRRENDFVANLIFGPLLGFDIKTYRASHWHHHMRLGYLDDTEFSYQTPFTVTQLLKEVLGVTLVQALLNYHRPTAGGIQKPLWPRLVCPLFHLAVLTWLGVTGHLAGLLAWSIGFFLVFPFVARVRQTLEHRELTAPWNQSENRRAQRPVTRMFGKGPFARCLGSAGFNRHLLHHLAPTISYTRFDEVEEFLMSTELRDHLIEHSFTYWQATKALLGGIQWKKAAAQSAARNA